MHLDDFLRRHTSRQLTEIVARDILDPYDHAGRMELALAKILTMLANRWRDPNKAEAMSVTEFLPTWGETYRQKIDTERLEETLATESAEQAVGKMKATFAAMRAARQRKV